MFKNTRHNDKLLAYSLLIYQKCNRFKFRDKLYKIIFMFDQIIH